MNNLMFDRKIEVNIGSQVYKTPDYTITFDVPDTTSDEPDVTEVNIYNITDATIKSIVSNTPISVNAGYGDDLGTIFSGRVERVMPEWRGVDKIVTIMATESGSKLRNKHVKKTYKANVKTSFMIRDLASQIGLKVADVSPTRDINHGKGRTVDGNGYTEIRKLAHESNSKVFIKGDKLYVRPTGKADSSGIVLNASTGMIGSPTREEREEEIKSDKEGQKPNKKKIVEYKVKSLLNHNIQKDTRIKIESRYINGIFRVTEVKHTSSFTTEITAR